MSGWLLNDQTPSSLGSAITLFCSTFSSIVMWSTIRCQNVLCQINFRTRIMTRTSARSTFPWHTENDSTKNLKLCDEWSIQSPSVSRSIKWLSLCIPIQVSRVWCCGVHWCKGCNIKEVTKDNWEIQKQINVIYKRYVRNIEKVYILY